MDYKKAFYSKLQDCYLGVKLKDFQQGNVAKNGFSNLLKIKERYFQHIKAYLDSQIEGKPQSLDIYNKLFTFFDSYLNESGTPFFNDTPAYKNIYAKVYSNSKDTSLFYKTQNLYYVKSDTLYQSLTLSDEKESYEVFFDASEFRQNADNNKNKIIFKFGGVESVNTETNDEGKAQIIIKVSNQKDLFPELNNAFKQNSNEFSEEFLKDLKQNAILKECKIKIDEEELKKIFRSYKKQSEVDFFIHKNARGFLREQFDLWMFNYLYKQSDIQEWNPQIIAHLQRIKNIAYEVIRLIGDFENELKAVWLKPKFAKRVEYVFSLDLLINSSLGEGNSSLTQDTRITDTFTPSSQSLKPQNNNSKSLIDSILNDKGFQSQIKEWQELNLIDENFDKQNFLDFCHSEPALAGEESKNMKSQQSNKRDISHFSNAQYDKVVNCHSEVLHSKAEESKDNKYRYLPIDTKHFTRETKYKILSSFENLESILNGELIKADNFQALNTLMPKYQGKVDLIYIDPPFNLGENASFDYKVNFKDSTWASLLDSRLELARDILSNNGSIFVRCDYNGNFIVRNLLNNIFGEDNFVNEIIVSKSAKLTETIKKYHSGNDSLFFFSKSEEYIFNVQGIEREERKWRAMHLPGERWSPIPKQYIDLFSKENLVFKNSKWTSKARIILGQEYLPPNGRHWALSQETIFELEKQGGIRLIDGVPKTQESDTKKLTSNWTDWVGYSSDWGFQTENHEKVLQRAILTGSNQDSIILDYHLGSGTTLAVAQKLGRKWLGIEMGEHFYSVVIPRLKKVIAGFQSGISKECDYQGGGAFRYYELESYEEALANCEYVLSFCHSKSSLCHTEALAEVSQQGNKRDISASPQYDNEIYKGKDYAKAKTILDYRKSRKLIDKLSKGESVCLDMCTEYREEFDIFHTMANLMGWKIKRLFLDSKGIESCEFDNGEILNLDSIDLAKYPKLKNLIFWN
ncbi:site-specific DNA-methyltransferase [Helicobacter muridarum]|uniref:Type III restriction-modification system methylation subunit n=3 Tax=Helicobacter muridarum TaxID=216 RepID=A0A377PS52_9HELI|nr:site-specific DNA-methyltransferase [Helicobacter muridarum]STQ85465.1 type III restriction-modification system methylation subunit [Helicobacter muridarum]